MTKEELARLVRLRTDPYRFYSVPDNHLSRGQYESMLISSWNDIIKQINKIADLIEQIEFAPVEILTIDKTK